MHLQNFFQQLKLAQIKPNTTKQNQLETDRKAAFGKQQLQTLINRSILPKIKGFYYMTSQLIIMPQFESVIVAKKMHTTMAEYLNLKHTNNFIVYNLTVKQDHSMFDPVLDYGIKKENLTPPLDILFLIVVEMAQWITKDPRHVVVMHASPIQILIVSCLMSVLHKNLFSASIANQYVSKMACKQLDQSMLRYLNYFDQVTLKEFTPLTRRLQLQKVVILSQEDDLFLQIHQCQGANFQKMIYHHHEKLHLKNFKITDKFLKDKELGTIIDLSQVKIEVFNDFQIRVFKHGKIEKLMGEPVCLHASFIQENFIRVPVCNGIQLDLIFSEFTGVSNYNYSNQEEDYMPGVTGQKINLKKVIEKNEESKDQFWISLVEQLKRDQLTKPKVYSVDTLVVNKMNKQFQEEEYFIIDDQDLPVYQHQSQTISQANVFDFSKPPAQSIPEKVEQISKQIIIGRQDEQQFSQQKNLDNSVQSISGQEAANINGKCNQSSDEEYEEYEKYLDQLQSAGDLDLDD